MAFTAPTKSQPLHNFNLPHLSWNKDGTAHHHNRPSRRPNSSDCSVKKSPIRGESSSSRSVDVREKAPIGADSVRRRDLELKEDRVRRSRGTSGVLNECDSRSDSRIVDFGGLRNESVDRMSSFGFGRGDTEKFVRRSEIGGDSVRRRDLELKEDGGRSKSGAVIECSRRKEDLGRSRSGVVIECSKSNSRIVDYDGFRNEGVNSMSSFERGNTERFEKKYAVAAEGDEAGIERSPKILIRIPGKNDKLEEDLKEEAVKVEHNDEDDEANGLEQEKIDTNKNSIDEEGKTWNLRPRKPLCKSLMTGGAVKNKGLAIAVHEKSKAHSPLRNMNNKPGEIGGIGSGVVGEKKEKRKLTVNIALTKREIEEDIFSWTGSKPARRPKKRAKNVQKQLDFLFPGLWLVSVTADSYKVSENSMKG